MYIINDGGRAEDVDALVEQYRYQFAGRVTTIHIPCRSQPDAASNHLLNDIHEDYIVLHDDGDSWHPYFLSECIGFLSDPKNEQYVAVMSSGSVIDEFLEGNIVRETFRTRWSGCHAPVIDGAALLTENFRPSISLLISTAAAKKIGYFDASIPALGGRDWNIRLFCQGDIGVIDKELAHHRRRSPNAGDERRAVDNHGHQYFEILNRNALIRAELQRGTIGLGGLQAILHSNNSIINLIENQSAFRGMSQINKKLDEVAELVDIIHDQQKALLQIASWQRKILRPVYWLWRKIYPLRHAVAIARGRANR